MRFATSIAALVSMGCTTTTPVFTLDPVLACPALDPSEEGGLLQHLTHADAVGDYAYAPPQPLWSNVEGDYDLETGAYFWSATYADGSYLDEVRNQGEGVVYTDGDVDLAYTRQIVRDDGDLDTVEVREVRLGCDVARSETSTSGNLKTVERGTYNNDGYTYVIERTRRGVVVPIEGRRAPDGTWSEDEAYRVDDFEYVGRTEGDDEGASLTTYREVDGNELREGTIKRFLDGRERHRFTATLFNAVFEWDYTIDFAGKGTGTATVEPNGSTSYTCDVIFKRGQCTIDCPDTPVEPC